MECTRVACFLEQQGGLVSLPLVTIAGLADGINPCAIGMMVTLLGYLIVFGGEKSKRIWQLGIAYIVSVFVTYLLIGLAFYSTVSQLQQIIQVGVVNKIIGVVLGGAGLVMLKDVVWPQSPLHLRIPGSSKEKLMKLIERVSLPGG